ncbi:MAG: hypothetical protein ACE5M4_09640, partial [Anaerolineales bacterium]
MEARFNGVFRDLRRDHAPAVDLALLSHAHQDHISDLEYVVPEIPAASSIMTAFIAKVLTDTGPAGRSGAVYINPRTYEKDGVLKTQRGQPYLARPWAFLDSQPGGELTDDLLATGVSFWEQPPSKSFAPRTDLLHPDVRILHWPVDHSLFGAAGFAVETEASWIGYTGDLRFHGQHGTQSQVFGEGLAGLKPTALLCEGTRLTEPNLTTEEMVYENCLAAVENAVGTLVVADFAPRNVERLLGFARIAEQTDRSLLVQPKDAYLLRAMHLADPNLPALMELPHVGLYADPKVSQYKWEQLVRERYASQTVSHLQVKSAPGEFILAFSLTDIPDLLDLHFLL